jgi:hypothetical protein
LLVRLCVLLFLVSSSAIAQSPPRWSLALTAASEARTSLETHRALIERALRVEMQDMVVQGRGDEPPHQVFLLISVRREGDAVLVQVWDRGEDMGTRLVSASGPPAVWSRRIALAVSELGRELSRKRELTLTKQRLFEERAQKDALRSETLRVRQKPRLIAGVTSLFLPDQAYSVGPDVGLRLNGDFPWSVGLLLGYQAGELLALQGVRPGGGAPIWSTISLGVAVDRAILLDRSVALTLGLDARALVVHVNGDADLDGLTGQRDSYLLLGGVHTGLAVDVRRHTALFIRADLGPVLRPLLAGVSGEMARISGGYFGLSLGVFVGAP